MPYQDQTLTCRDCGKSFVFTARDQEFFAEKGFTNAPTRCKDCRVLKKKAPAGAPAGAGSANKALFKITCKKCGKVGEMATEPRKPEDVLCSECFYDDFKKQLAEQGFPAPKPEQTPTEEETTDGIVPQDE
ncbi:MAG TPA: zinc-ribbon domain-containing protein [Patescibacteria group bacterium]